MDTGNLGSFNTNIITELWIQQYVEHSCNWTQHTNAYNYPDIHSYGSKGKKQEK